MRIYYTLTTIDPVIVSQNNATTTNHECLDYIPGSAILGAFAAQYYSQFTEAQSWNVFHSGQVKFSPCYPLVNNEIALPTPASWNFSKNEMESLIQQGKYNTQVLSNHSAFNFTRDEEVQYKQCRTGYVNSQGFVANVKMGNSTKTALSSETGSAKDGQLFTYSFIEAGQTFAGWVELNDSDNDISSAINTLLNSNIRIGRSRNTEFGRVQLTITEKQAMPIADTNLNELVLWCVSDSEFINDSGLPTLTPSGKNIHPALSEASLIPEKSFIRSVKVSRFNQKRQGLDSEQVLVAKGSVLTYKLASPLTPNVLDDINTHGVGINQQYGLGWVSANPAWSVNASITGNNLFTPLSMQVNKPKVKPNNSTNSMLLQWLSSQVSKQETAVNIQENVNQLIQKIIQLYKSARKYHHILQSNEAGPSSTQWSLIRQEVSSNNEQWKQRVFNGEHAICKAKNDELGWGITLPLQGGETTFADETEKLLAHQDIATMRLLSEQLGCDDLSQYKQLKKTDQEYAVKASEKGSYAHG